MLGRSLRALSFALLFTVILLTGLTARTDALIDQAREHLAHGQRDHGLELLRQAQDSPLLKESQALRICNSYDAADAPDLRVDSCQRLVTTHPTPTAWFALAQAHLDAHDYASAADDFAHFAPSSSQPYDHLWYTYALLLAHQPARAEQAARQMLLPQLVNTPAYSERDARILLALALEASQQPTEARAIYDDLHVHRCQLIADDDGYSTPCE